VLKRLVLLYVQLQLLLMLLHIAFLQTLFPRRRELVSLMLLLLLLLGVMLVLILAKSIAKSRPLMLLFFCSIESLQLCNDTWHVPRQKLHQTGRPV
jgi:hypothetical protein